MSCVLRLSGKDFDVERFVQQAGWRNMGDKLRVHNMGEYVNALKRRKYVDNGLSILVSDRGFDDMAGQQADIMSFIELNMGALLLLKKHQLDGWSCFDMGLDQTPPNNFSKTYILQPKLMELLGTLGLELYISNYFAKQERVGRRYKRRRWPFSKR